MKLTTVIQQAMDTYPSMYHHREQVLDQIFCVIGNGYSWYHDGSAREDSGEPRTKKITLEEDIADSFDSMLDMHKRIHKTLRKKVSFAKYRRQRIKERVKEDKNQAKPVCYYPLCEYSLVSKVPENVQQDCLDACFEVLDLVLACDPKRYFKDFTPSSLNETFIKKQQEREKILHTKLAKEYRDRVVANKRVARGMLKKLEERFPDRIATGTGKISLPERLDPSMFNSEDDLLKFDTGDKVRVRFGTGYKVPKKYKGRRLVFNVNNCKKYKYRIKSKVLVLTSAKNVEDVVVVHPTDRFECLMIDLFAVNRMPYKGWRNKKLKLTKVK